MSFLQISREGYDAKGRKTSRCSRVAIAQNLKSIIVCFDVCTDLKLLEVEVPFMYSNCISAQWASCHAGTNLMVDIEVSALFVTMYGTQTMIQSNL